MNKLFNGIKDFASSEEGASGIEYGLMAALIAAVIIAAVSGIGTRLKDVFTDICKKLGGSC